MLPMIGIVLIVIFILQQRRVSNLKQEVFELRNERSRMIKEYAIGLSKLDTKYQECLSIAKKEYTKLYNALKVADVDCLERLSVELNTMINDDESFEDEEEYEKYEIVLEFILTRLQNME